MQALSDSGMDLVGLYLQKSTHIVSILSLEKLEISAFPFPCLVTLSPGNTSRLEWHCWISACSHPVDQASLGVAQSGQPCAVVALFVGLHRKEILM